MSSSPHTLDAASQQKLKQFFELGLKVGCSRDQLTNISQAGSSSPVPPLDSAMLPAVPPPSAMAALAAAAKPIGFFPSSALTIASASPASKLSSSAKSANQISKTSKASPSASFTCFPMSS